MAKQKISPDQLISVIISGIEDDIFVQHINFPTVQKGSERLRITPTPFHTVEDIEKLTKALSGILTDLNIMNLKDNYLSIYG